MKRILLTIVLPLLCFSCMQAQVCADSSFHEQYTFTDSLYPTCEIPLLDGGRLQLLRKPLNGSSSRNDLVIRYGDDARPLWQQQLLAQNGTDLVEISRAAELANGNLVLSGFARVMATQERLFYVVMLSPAGQILWQKMYEYRDITSVAGNFGASNKINGTICQTTNDSLLFVFYIESENIVGDKLALLCTDPSGNTGWATTVVIPTVADSWVIVSKAKLKGRKLWMYGAHRSANYCSDAAPSPGYINKGKLMAIEFDLDTHSIVSQHSFCPPITTISGASGSVAGYQNFGGLNEDASFYGQDVFFLNDGRIALTRSRLRATNIPGIKNWLFSISYFDSDFNHLKSELITTGSLFLRSTIQSVNLDGDGNKYFHFVDYASATTYYAVCDNNNQFVIQKKIRGNWASPLLHQPRFFSRPGRSLNFEIFNMVNGQTQLDYFDIQAGGSNSACFGEDTSFLSIETATVTTAGINGTIYARQSNLSEHTVSAAFHPAQVSAASICVDKNICDTIDLKMNGPYCFKTGTVKLTAYKNPLCKGPVSFHFDSTAVLSYTQTDDTTLVLVLRPEGYVGEITANPFSCPQLEDSVLLNIPASSAPLDIGKDQLFCPGRSYRIAAPSGYLSYKWQDGSSDSFIVVYGPGYYSVEVMDECGEKYTDSIYLQPAAALYAGKDTSVCSFSTLRLQGNAGFSNYAWKNLASPGFEQAGRVIDIHPETSSYYMIAADLFAGCRLTDTLLVSVVSCSNRLYIPTAFTPNDDGLNDTFGARIDGAVDLYRLSIFNRWGTRIFFTSDPHHPWDGKVNGTLQPSGAFIWRCEYRFYGLPAEQKQGTVMLVR